MMKIEYLADGSMALVECTAVATTAGDTEPQNAVLCVYMDIENGIQDEEILFCDGGLEAFGGVDGFDEYAADNPDSFSSYYEDLDIVRIDWKPISYYDFWAVEWPNA